MKKLSTILLSIYILTFCQACATQPHENNDSKIYVYGNMINPYIDIMIDVESDRASFFVGEFVFDAGMCTASSNPEYHCFFASNGNGYFIYYFAVPKSIALNENARWKLNDVQFSVVDNLDLFWQETRSDFWVIKGVAEDEPDSRELLFVYNGEYGLIALFENLDTATTYEGVNFTSESFFLLSGPAGFGAE
ncbi:MAG: hypothetical protein DHS20C05_09010 [Hyphococcus sp.]|nr:MAG: hypothetical protein DHS20C05_09010 [Marinicaulis sp.]